MKRWTVVEISLRKLNIKPKFDWLKIELPQITTVRTHKWVKTDPKTISSQSNETKLL